MYLEIGCTDLLLLDRGAQIVEDCDERLSSEIVDQFLTMVDDTLPPPPEPLEDTDAQANPVEADVEGDEMETDVEAAEVKPAAST